MDTRELPTIRSILHPSDFSAASEVAFAHALKAALIAKASLTLLHVSPDMGANWSDFPGIRETLARWGLLPPDSPASAVPSLGIDVRKAIAHDRNPVSSVLRYLDNQFTDLVVLAPHHHDGRMAWFHQSFSEPVARESGQATLFVPDGVKGFVSVHDGSVSLKSVLIPVAAAPLAQPALAAAARLVSQLSQAEGTFTLLHVGSAGDVPVLDPPEVPGWKWDRRTESGEVVEAILDTANRTNADLIVMTTDGRDGFLDALRGSHSERVLRRTPCALLAIPERAAPQVGARLNPQGRRLA